MTTREEALVKSGNKADTPAVPRPAASLVILRGEGKDTEVLMGRRPDTARFMPGVYVYPGGAVDPGDGGLASALGGNDTERAAHAACAIRETWEEAGVILGTDGAAPPAEGLDPESSAFIEASRAVGVMPRPDLLRYFCHAITPKEVPIRFDVRFFLCGAELVVGKPHATGELPEVDWVPCETALSVRNVSGITKRVLREAMRLWGKPDELADPERRVAQIYYEASGYRIERTQRGGDWDAIWAS